MAERLLQWRATGTYTEKNLKLEAFDAATKNPLGVFQLAELLPHSAVIDHLVEFGMRQTLADAGAEEKTATGKIKAASERFQAFAKGEVSTKRSAAPISFTKEQVEKTAKDFGVPYEIAEQIMIKAEEMARENRKASVKPKTETKSAPAPAPAPQVITRRK